MLTFLLITAVILIFVILIIIDKIRFKKNRRYYGYDKQTYCMFGCILIVIALGLLIAIEVTRICFYINFNSAREEYSNIIADKSLIENHKDNADSDLFVLYIHELNKRIDIYNEEIAKYKNYNDSPWLNIYVPNKVISLKYIDKIE